MSNALCLILPAENAALSVGALLLACGDEFLRRTFRPVFWPCDYAGVLAERLG